VPRKSLAGSRAKIAINLSITINKMNSLESLYESDFNLWLETHTNLLKQKQFIQMDIEHLIEEIEDMGNNRKDALESNLMRVFQHLLKWKYQPEKRSNSWRASITEHSLRLNKAIKKSPSLKPYFANVYRECYQDARLIASRETGLDIKTFPADCPFAPEQVLNPDYLPD
jgi:hypothetical protein